MYIGLLMLVLGLKMFSKRNIIRGLMFVAPVGAHMLFRHSYYGGWAPNTLGAKTGNFAGQLIGGRFYLEHYIEHSGPILLLALAGAVWALAPRRRDMFAILGYGPDGRRLRRPRRRRLDADVPVSLPVRAILLLASCASRRARCGTWSRQRKS